MHYLKEDFHEVQSKPEVRTKMSAEEVTLGDRKRPEGLGVDLETVVCTFATRVVKPRRAIRVVKFVYCEKDKRTPI